MISAKQNLEALQEWALEEIKNLGQRNFELAKFFFGISAGSFAIIPFFDLEISLGNKIQLAALVSLGVSVVCAVLMASPARFIVDDNIDLPRVHRRQANWLGFLKYSWMTSWMLGVLLVFIAVSGGSEQKETPVNSEAPIKSSSTNNG